MSTAVRFTVQSVVAGAVAAALILVALDLASEAQETTDQESVTQETSAEEPSAADADGGSAVAACHLVTEAEAVAALGAEVTVVDDPGQCTYVAEDLTGRAVSVAAVPPTLTAESLGPSMEQMAGALNADVRDAAVGDEAYLVTGGGLTQVAARSGDDIVIVVLTTSKDSVDEQAATLSGLASTALSRM